MSFLPITHTNPAFNELVGEIGAQLTEMFTLAETALGQACAALADNDADLARSVVRADGRINELESAITLDVATALARYQPVAHDLHALMGSVKIALELERLADHAKNVCRRVCWLHACHGKASFHADLLRLGNVTVEMLHELIVAEVANDNERSLAVRARDREANDIYHGIMERALAGEGRDDQRVLINSLFVAKNFERVGDKVKNLTEIVHYQRTGENLDFD